MKDHDVKQRRTKFRITQRVFTKAFSFKRKGHTGCATSIKRRRSSGDDASTFSTSVLIVPSVQRLTASSPPLAILDRIYGSNSLSTGRPPKILTLFSSSPPVLQTTGSPYQSKKAQKSLSATLNNCHHKSVTKHSHSAWERRHPSNLNRGADSPWLRPISVAEGSRVVDIDIAITESTNSEFLPPDISPANRFVPIGHEEDDDGIISFASDDYDICTKSVGEFSHQKARVDNTSMNEYSDDGMFDKYSVSLNVETKLPLDLPPSPMSTEGTSSQSRDSYVMVRKKGHQKGNYRFQTEKSGDHDNKDWFPSMKQEIMKLASCFTQCGVPSKSTL